MHSQRFWQVTTKSCWGGILSPEAILPAICPSFPTVAFDTQLLLLPQLRPSFCVLSPCWTQGSSFFSQTLHSHEPIPFNWILGEMGAEGSTKKNKLKLNLHFELHWPHSLLGKFLPPLVDFRYLQMDEYMSSVYLGFPPHPLKMFTYLDALGLCWITWDVSIMVLKVHLPYFNTTLILFCICPSTWNEDALWVEEILMEWKLEQMKLPADILEWKASKGKS